MGHIVLRVLWVISCTVSIPSKVILIKTQLITELKTYVSISDVQLMIF